MKTRTIVPLVIAGVLAVILLNIVLLTDGDKGKDALSNDPNFEDLLDAIEFVESRGNPNAVCENGCCIGAYQLSCIYVDECDRIANGKSVWASDCNYAYADRWNKDKSRAMTRLYIDYYSKQSIIADSELLNFCPKIKWFEIMARIHNGGPNGWMKTSTKKYWLKVKTQLEKSK